MPAVARPVVRRRAPDGAWEIAVSGPDERLQPFVRTYCGYSDSPGSLRRELPSPWVTLIVGLRAPLRVRGGCTGGATALRRHFLAGLDDDPAFTQPLGPARGVEVKLTPIGAHLVLGEHMGGLSRQIVELEDLLGADAGRLAEQLDAAPAFEDCAALLDGFLLRRIAEARPLSPAVAWAWERLAASGGRVEVGALAEAIGWSPKHLRSRFLEQVGVSPKLAARLIRFDRVVRAADAEAEPAWADLAYDAGYYDQAHLIREVRALSGLTPVRLHAERRGAPTLPDEAELRFDPSKTGAGAAG
jgi:AraC-like DNA-binding protein